MVNDTVVGVLGALVIVGSMAGVIQMVDDSGTSGSNGVEGPPPAAGQSRFSSEDCRAMTLVWTPDRSTLDEMVGPRWTPARASAVPGVDAGSDNGVFMLFGYECPKTAVDGLGRGSMTGGGALVPVEAPDDPRNVSADAWVAAPEIVQSRSSAIFDAFREHHFETTDGSVAVGIQSTPLSTQVRMVFDTPDGQVEASAMFQGSATSFDKDVSVVGTSPAWFSAMHGAESGERQTTQSATVETSGNTWIDELDLAPTPSEVTYDTGFGWDFTLEHEPWETANGTASVTVR